MASTRRLAAIMFTDMVGSTALAQTDEAEALRLRDEQAELIRPLFAAHQGREVKSMGDGFLAEFDSALRAVQCAIDIQQRLHERNSQTSHTPIRLRIGIHLGDVETRGTDIFGDSVNVASRIEPLAEPGGICVTEPVFGQVGNKIPNRLERLEPKVLKNVKVPMEIYRVTLPWDLPSPSKPESGIPRLAVLPLANISPDPKDEYFADGLTEELISVLSQIRGLRVVSRTSASQYKATTKSVAQIGAELRVGSVLEGSVRRAGDQLRITMQLIDVETDDHRWAQTYDRKLDNVFAIQAEVAEQTAGALRIELLKSEREAISRPPTRNLGAYKSYLQGIHAQHQLEEESAVRFFEEAIRQDPSFSLACSSLANTLIKMFGNRVPRREILPRAKEMVTRALELNPLSSEAHAARGNSAFQFELDWERAEAEFKEAIRLNPSDSSARYWYGHLLMALQRFDEAIVQLRTSIDLDPLDIPSRSDLANAYSFQGDADAASAAARQIVSLSPRIGHSLLAWIYLESGQRAEARKEALQALEAFHNPSPFDPRLPEELGKRSEASLKAWILESPDDARAYIARWKANPGARYVPLGAIAFLYLGLGETEEALDLLESDYRDGDQLLWYYAQLPELDGIRDNPRFVALLRAMKLPTAAPKRGLAFSRAHPE